MIVEKNQRVTYALLDLQRERDLLAEQIEKLLVQLRKLRDSRCQDRPEILRQCRKKVEDSQVSIDMYNGVFKINLARTMTCPSLDAYKWAAKEVQRMLSDPPLCEQCQGEGAAPCMFCGGAGRMPSEGKGKGATCYACRGRGATICTTCRGTGYKRMG